MSSVLEKNFFADGEWAVKGVFEKKNIYLSPKNREFVECDIF
jgi:hypothetical protein